MSTSAKRDNPFQEPLNFKPNFSVEGLLGKKWPTHNLEIFEQVGKKISFNRTLPILIRMRPKPPEVGFDKSCRKHELAKIKLFHEVVVAQSCKWTCCTATYWLQKWLSWPLQGSPPLHIGVKWSVGDMQIPVTSLDIHYLPMNVQSRRSKVEG